MEQLAQRRIRFGIALLVPGALFNGLLMSRGFFAQLHPLTPGWADLRAAVLLVGILITFLLFWRGAAWLMPVSVLFHIALARSTDRAGWINATLEGTRGIVPAMGLVGAIWLTYDLLFLAGNLVYMSLFGTLALICGAVAYVPILVQWLRYWRESRNKPTLIG